MAPMTAREAVTGVMPTVSGLPLHPLVVHVAVVLLPLSALAVLAVLAVPRWRRPYGPLAAGFAVVGAAGAFVAKRSGEDLAGSLGRPAEHAAWGDRLAVLAIAYAVLVVLWWVLDRRAEDRPTGDATAVPQPSAAGASIPARLLAGAVAVLAVATVGATVATGHTGATAVWSDAGTDIATAPPTQQSPDDAGTAAPPAASAPEESSSAPPVPTAAPSPTADPSEPAAPSPTTDPSGPATAVYSLDEVAQHSSDASCWAAIDGGVYDLTTWIRRHPGGADRILGLCGTDATSAFQGQHDDDRQPNQQLAEFRIGDLG